MISGSWPMQPVINRSIHARQISLAACTRFDEKSQARSQRFTEGGKCPDPGGAVVIGRFAARILLAFVAAPVGLEADC